MSTRLSQRGALDPGKYLTAEQVKYMAQQTGEASKRNLTVTGHTKGDPKHWRFSVPAPATRYSISATICICPVTDAFLTVDSVTVTCNANPTTEPTGDLKYADAYIGLANAVVINAFDTADGVLVDASITAPNVPKGKCIYLSFDITPEAAMTEMAFDIAYHY